MQMKYCRKYNNIFFNATGCTDLNHVMIIGSSTNNHQRSLIEPVAAIQLLCSIGSGLCGQEDVGPLWLD